MSHLFALVLLKVEVDQICQVFIFRWIFEAWMDFFVLKKVWNLIFFFLLSSSNLSPLFWHFSINISLFEILFFNVVRKYVSIVLNACLPVFKVTLSWWRSLSHKSQSIDLQSKLMDWFLYHWHLCHVHFG